MLENNQSSIWAKSFQASRPKLSSPSCHLLFGPNLSTHLNPTGAHPATPFPLSSHYLFSLSGKIRIQTEVHLSPPAAQSTSTLLSYFHTGPTCHHPPLFLSFPLRRSAASHRHPCRIERPPPLRSEPGRPQVHLAPLPSCPDRFPTFNRATEASNCHLCDDCGRVVRLQISLPPELFLHYKSRVAEPCLSLSHATTSTSHARIAGDFGRSPLAQ